MTASLFRAGADDVQQRQVGPEWGPPRDAADRERLGAAKSATAELPDAGAAKGAPSKKALDRLGTQKLVTYQRIRVGLTRQRLDQLGFSDIDPVKVRELDAADQIQNMQRISAAIAKEPVQMDALKHFFKLGGSCGPRVL